MKIIADAFGGDNAPVEVLKGCRLAVTELEDVEIVLTGDKDTIEKTAREHQIPLDHMEICHAGQVMDIHTEPTALLKEFSDSSMAVGCRLLAEGKGDAFVSAGSTGALVVGATFLVKRIKGIKRVTIGSVIPCQGGCYLLADAGANADCRPEMLMQFAVMGSIYMQRFFGIPSPRVGLVNIGAEETKGSQLQLDAYPLLQSAPVNFIGNIEPREIPLGGCDVAVADGFTGNVVLKLTEGMAKMILGGIKEIFMSSLTTKLAALLVAKPVQAYKKRMDASEIGGALLLGVRRPVIKAHGNSNGRAFMNAIRQAALCCENHVVDRISASLGAAAEDGEA